MIEQWKYITTTDCHYLISNIGRVKRSGTEFIRKQFKKIDGYMMVSLYFNGKRVTKSIHRLVAIHFIGNPRGLPCVNHKDLNKNNNCVDNLEWCTHVDNMAHAVANKAFKSKGTFTEKHKLAMKVFRKKVIAFDKDNNETLEFNSHKQCASYFNVLNSTISSTMIQKSKLRGKYNLFHEEDWQQFATENNL